MPLDIAKIIDEVSKNKKEQELMTENENANDNQNVNPEEELEDTISGLAQKYRDDSWAATLAAGIGGTTIAGAIRSSLEQEN